MLLMCEQCRELFTGQTEDSRCVACGDDIGSDGVWRLGDACAACNVPLVEAVVMTRSEARKLAGVVDETPQGSQP